METVPKANPGPRVLKIDLFEHSFLEHKKNSPMIKKTCASLYIDHSMCTK